MSQAFGSHNRITKKLRQSGISGDHLTQPSAPSRANFQATAGLAGFSPVATHSEPVADALLVGNVISDAQSLFPSLQAV